MQKYVSAIFDYWYAKVWLGLIASLWSDDLPILFCLFVLLEIIDILTRWLALTADWYKKTYPQCKGNLFIYCKWILQARRWRWIKSTGLRDGFCNKMLVYLILLLLSATVDGALAIAHMPRILLSIVVTVLAATEALSILENLNECDVAVIKQIKEKFNDKIDKIAG